MMFTISFSIMLNVYLSYGSCTCIFAYSVYSCFLFFSTKIVLSLLFLLLKCSLGFSNTAHFLEITP